VVLLTSHVRGIALQSRAAAPSSAPEAQLLAALGTVLRDHGADYPHLAAATASSVGSGTQGQDQALEFGLEVLIAERARS
jgi:hypothetical protein